ncbi:DUF4240 domain-containing protein [Flavonifractor sp. An10]|uniref:DUF4240 domain-containing protein n=1 Tax=Flavonifractor sp. An10 TaxID=1965537 RepID=UPI000B3674FE|nr:DUF4240 domain-containing protein [Flavonifractor sp. An10]OUQ84030.1 hypothetical protein B5E42_05095 [Flavonifractor sp. An10]
MTKEEFWSTIETARQAVPDGSQSMMAEQIYRELLQKPPEDILDWNLYFYEYRDAACRNDLQAASTALGVPATSDGFLDFRTWLVAQGKEIYLAAIDNPDTLAKDPHIGAEMSFPSFADCAVDAYAEKLSLADEEERRRLYNALNHHKLTDQSLNELQRELPQHPDISSGQLLLDYSAQFPNIWERMTSRSPELRAMEDKFDYFIPIRDVVYAAVYQNGSCAEYRFPDTPRDIANFIGSRPCADEIVLTDTLDRLLLDTRGSIIYSCPDKELLAKVTHFLVPIQTGEIQPEPVLYECLSGQEPCQQSSNDGLTMKPPC